MPYEGEFAQYRSIKRLAESERVKNLLGSYTVRSQSDLTQDIASLEGSDVVPSNWLPKLVMAVDGSHAEVPVQNGFPGAEASYVTVASVIVNLAKTIELDEKRPINPVEFRTLEQSDSIDCALPGCNVVADGDESAKASLRRKLLEVLKSVRMAEGAETLLDTYQVLLKYKPSSRQDCPFDSCPNPDGKFLPGDDCYECTCDLKHGLFSTDALRIHEGMNPVGSNGAMFAEIMQVLERIWIIHVLRTMESHEWLPLLKDMAIVLDGPLAVFGHPAWLSKAIRKELIRINTKARAVNNGQDMLLIGIEKTGAFVQHFESLDTGRKGESALIPHQRVALLTDSYIKSNITFTTSDKLYGQDTYFGRKFLYKTKSGARIVAMVPFLDEIQEDTRKASADLYPRLPDVLNLLDRLVSSRYPNALTPLVSAHAEAAIPMNLGKRVLESIAKELIGN